MLALPLFHVHPEVDHLHGKAGHVHGGKFHTLLAGNLPCEFRTHENAGSSGVTLLKHTPRAGHQHPEIGFSVLTDTNDHKVLTSHGAQTVIAAIAVRLVLHDSSSAEEHALVPSPQLFFHDRFSRAPPILL